MDTKLCRICGKSGKNYINIFRTEGLKNKIETCLPIIVSPHHVLPDTICLDCGENVDNFFSFIKNCLQNIIIFESQFDVIESCLKSKRKAEKSCSTHVENSKCDKNTQTEDFLDLILGENGFSRDFHFPLTSKFLNQPKNHKNLVDYEIISDNSESEDDSGKVTLPPNLEVMQNIELYVENLLTTKNLTHKNKLYFSDKENDLVKEINQRKCLKRKSDFVDSQPVKIFKMTNGNRRKNNQPKKLDFNSFITENDVYQGIIVTENGINDSDFHQNELFLTDNVEKVSSVAKEIVSQLPQVCLLCEEQFANAALLATHVFETHGINMGEIVQNGGKVEEKKKKIPSLVKISDVKKELTEDNQNMDQNSEDPPTLVASFVCPSCPAEFTCKTELYSHIRTKHAEISALLCGICLYQSKSHANLKSHVELCVKNHTITSRYVCQTCFYGDDNFKSMEEHVLVHSFLLDICKKESKMFDPDEYIQTNENFDTGKVSPKIFTCSECSLNNFETFKDFSAHRRSEHSLFHCDLCIKFYGRNSHLWKHVNRLHKGHPSITCQICFKTSASKYHLQQHFNKIHSQKNQKLNKSSDLEEIDDFMTQKFQAFDFQSVKQSFMKQEILERHKTASDLEDRLSDQENLIDEKKYDIPKEIDSTSNLYTNIITNYTPPVNIGEFKCLKCGKNFQKKALLKKHKKNCRPRLQKDLLTRCKSCARVFKDRQSLAKHLVNYHSEYICEICNQKVQSKCEIVSHIRFQHTGCHLVCSLCENILRSKSDMDIHKQNHSESHICQFCGDPLPSKIKLKMHVLSLHRKILSLSCGVCLKLFETQHILKNHVQLVHKDELSPLNSCTVCGKNYGSKWKTYDHLNKSHGRIFKACRSCLEVFDNDDQLELHSITVHNKFALKNEPRIKVEDIKTEDNHDDDILESEVENEEGISEGNNSEEENHISDYVEENRYMPIEHKISLLEKRLMGEKITKEDLVNIKTIPKVEKIEEKPKINRILEVKNKIEVKNNQKDTPRSIKTKPKIRNKQALHPYSEESTKIVKTEPKSKTKLTAKDSDAENNKNTQHNSSSKRTVYVDSDAPSHCEICFKQWPAKKHLWQHYIRCHKTVAATVCGICLKTNDSYENLQDHLTSEHPTLLHGQGFGSNFICRICGRYHNASSKLRLHMVIHEKFDWGLLDQKDEAKDESVNGYDTEERGYRYSQDGDMDYEEEEEDIIQKTTNNLDNINYEDDIEQIECSSESAESSNGERNPDDSSSSDDSSEDDSEEEKSIETYKSQMIQNIILENQRIAQIKQNDRYEIISSEDSSFSEENIRIKSENDTEDDLSRDEGNFLIQTNSKNSDAMITTPSGNIFRCKPEELDSAIKSISYGCMDTIKVDSDEEFFEMQESSLNENELESAVGSIL